MLFKDKLGEHHFKEGLHPDTRAVMVHFDQWSADNRLPEPLWAELGRTREINATYYVRMWLDIQTRHRDAPGTLSAEDHKWLDGTRRKDCPAILGLTPEQLYEAGLGLFSWHIELTAADLSLKPYNPEQRRKVWAWFEKECAGERWELLLHSVTGVHVHIARRDGAWSKRLKEVGNV